MGNVSTKTLYGLILVVLVFTQISTAFVSATQVTSRSVAIGSSEPSAVTNHRFQFDIPTVSNLGSIQFEYCSNSPQHDAPCAQPAGLNVSSTVLSAQTGEVGFTVDPATTANSILISRVPSLNSPITVAYNFTNITNPSSLFEIVYVRISTFATADGSGARTDEGSVAFGIDENVTVSGFVPPFLIFCVGVTVAGNCSSASGEFISFGELDDNQPKFLTSQFAGATNDPGGYSTFVAGLTMTSGTNTISAIGAPSLSIPGTSQFGMNLRANSNPGVGSDPSGVGTSAPNSDFNQVNLFKFNNQQVTNSPISTDFNLFTVSYVVNIANGQAPGVYNTTLTYIAVAAF